MSEQEAYDQLALYTLAKGDTEFIHQHIVDAYAAQHAEDNLKPIKTSFALIGLYLMLEKGYSGKEVQEAHMRLGREKRDWPHFSAPEGEAGMTVFDVMRAAPGAARDEAIARWCAAVWETWRSRHQQVADLLNP